jgi:NDP-sugar pyrophosphorylase family protein
MILAAGEGRRLRPLTERIPKALVEVGGKPLVEYAIDNLVRYGGVHDVVVNLHHLGEQIRDRLGDGSRFGLRIHYSEERTLLGSGGGIVHARELLGAGTFVTLNADTIIDIDLALVLAYHRERGAAATLVLRKDPRMAEFGLLHTDASGRIVRFLKHERPGASGPAEPFMFTGVQVLEPRVFDYMPGHGAFSITEITYPRMLHANEPLFGYPFEGPWITVGTPQELAAAEAEIKGYSLDSRKGPALS